MHIVIGFDFVNKCAKNILNFFASCKNSNDFLNNYAIFFLWHNFFFFSLMQFFLDFLKKYAKTKFNFFYANPKNAKIYCRKLMKSLPENFNAFEFECYSLS